MKIVPIQVKVSDLTKNYSDDGDGGVFGYDNRLTIRPRLSAIKVTENVKEINYSRFYQ